MLGKLFGRQPIHAWAIKQIDEATLHLCGQGTLESDQKRKAMLEALHADRFDGGIRMEGTGIVLHSRRLAAVVPLEALQLLQNGDAAEWNGRRWAVSHVPQRAWLFDGGLVAEPNPAGGPPALISQEDVAHIRQNVRHDAKPSREVQFRPVNETEDPEKDLRASIEEAQRRRKEANSNKGWRKDGSWGALDDMNKE